MSVVVDLARSGDDDGVRRLVRSQTMPGRVRLAFCREPEFAIGCAVTGDDSRVLVARSEQGEIVGVACRSVRHVFINGSDRRIGYLGQLRVDGRYRGRWLVSRGFALLEKMDRSDPLPVYLTSIVEGNDEATAILVTRRRRSFPALHEVARFSTVAIRVRRLTNGAGRDQIGPGSPDQLEEIAAFLRITGAQRQLSTVWTADGLRRLEPFGLRAGDMRIARRGGRIVGVLALWDQSAFKQSVVRGYSGWLKGLAPVLPRPGTELRCAYASLVCIANGDAGVFADLLRDVHDLALTRGVEYLLVGLDVRDPLLPVARAYRHLSYPSRLYLASWPGGGPHHEQLDARPAYVDIATL